MEKERLELLKSLVNEISKGMEQVKEVKMCCSNSEQDGVLERMLSSHEEALSILTGRDPQGQCQSVISSSSNPPGSSTSVSKVAHSKYLRERKTRTDSWKVKMKTSKGASLDDGYRWRKYGQKDILGAKYPRSYYKCITRGCPARRTLQRLDDDPTTIDVTYNNIKHTCQAGSKPESHTEETQESMHAKMEP